MNVALAQGDVRLEPSHAFASGFTRIEFRVDGRNLRSRAAVLKLGATHEGILRKNRITWTGHVRDTYVFSLLRHEWPGTNGQAAAREPSNGVRLRPCRSGAGAVNPIRSSIVG